MKLGLVFVLIWMFCWVPAAFASHYDLPDIDLLPDSVVLQLAQDKIDNTEELFARLVKKSEREVFAKKYSMNPADVDALAHKLELMQIVGVGPKAASLLMLAGVNNLNALSQADPNALLDALLRVNREQNITGVQPDLTVVRDWIAKSQKIANRIED